MNISCGSAKKIKMQENEIQPEWLLTRPKSSMYYIGIGVGRKTIDLQHSKIAKEEALTDLASEISITINSNTMMNVLEDKDGFSESFRSDIRSSINASLEGYELIDSYENDAYYYVYYRLSKSKYEEVKQKNKEIALTKSKDALKKAIAFEKNSDILNATNFYFQSLKEIQNYWGELNQVEFNGDTILLFNEIIDRQRKMYNNIHIISDYKEVNLNYADNFQHKLTVTANYNGNKVANLPIRIEYWQKSFKNKKTLFSDHEGNCTLIVKNVDTDKINSSIQVKLDFDKIINNQFKERTLLSIFDQNKKEYLNLPIQIIYPVIYVSSEEKNLNSPLELHKIKETLIAGLTKKGFKNTKDSSQADLYFTIKANTRKSESINSNIKVAYLDYTIEVLNTKKNIIVLKEIKINIKGAHATYYQAGLEAYKNALEYFEIDVIPEIIEGLKSKSIE